MKKKGFGLQVDAFGAVICIMILMAAVAANAPNILDGGKTDKAYSDCANLGSLVSQYHLEVGSYPSTLSSLTSSVGQYGPWVASIPNDPWGNAYQYQYNTSKFIIYSYGKDKTGSGSSVGNGIANGDIGFVGK